MLSEFLNTGKFTEEEEHDSSIGPIRRLSRRAFKIPFLNT